MFQIPEFHQVFGLKKKEKTFLTYTISFKNIVYSNNFFKMAILNFLKWQQLPYPLVFDGLP